ncbi:MAG: phospho-N-acetylmuramoyl-pentapeptide-transferase [Oscillospiraceae bacterium]|nr:phospho-N-acetylmuramoyl-pentapeptide-transferase [Oscillospiraceae bacterium]
MILKIVWAFVGAMLAATVTGSFLVPYLRKKKMGQYIREDGPTWHNSKAGTPTMGGLMFITGIAFILLAGGIGDALEGDWRFFIIFGFSLIYAAIGFLDDYEKLKKKQNLGLTTLQKLALQIAAAILLIMLLRIQGHLSSNLYVPFLDVSFIMPDWLYLVFALFVIVGTVNAVNITDGIDGLAAGVTLPVALCYAALAAAWGFSSVGMFGAALAGGLVGFLIFNFYPAKIFMGDTGSLFLGGAVCATAFCLDMPLILVPLGLVYIWETLSDIIQVVYFKLTHGKRFFKMAPFHHHLEQCGWKETRIWFVFTGISAALAILTFFGVVGRYH